jgi:hypothetical protein
VIRTPAAPLRSPVVTPYAAASLLLWMLGSIARGMPKKPSSSSSQSRVVRSMSIVRLALVTSVAWMPPSGPPVRFHTTQVSGVPKRASPRSAAARRPSTFSSSHCTLPAEKYVAGGRPALRRITSPRPSASSALAIESVRVSCQTTALYQGRPVRRSHTMAVSRWLVTPIAARSLVARPALVSALPMTVCVRSQISSGLCSTHPARGRIWSCSSWWLATGIPSWSKTMNRVLVVPWSTAPMKSAMAAA